MYTRGEPTGEIADYLDWIISAEGQVDRIRAGFCSDTRGIKDVQTQSDPHRPKCYLHHQDRRLLQHSFPCTHFLLPDAKRVPALKETGLAKLFQIHLVPDRRVFRYSSAFIRIIAGYVHCDI